MGDILMPELSIIVPIYNMEKYLEKCVSSILEQTFTNFELILVNDGSTDRSEEICRAFRENDHRVKVISKNNGGVADARNAGIRQAKGSYLGFVDGDDWVEADMFEQLMNICKKYEADISACLVNAVTYDSYKRKPAVEPKVDVYDSHTAIRKLYEGELPSGFSVCNKIFKRNLFDNLEFPKGRIYEDAAIICRLLDRANKVCCVDLCLYNYLTREASITRIGFSEKRFDIIPNYQEKYYRFSRKHPDLCEILTLDYFNSLYGIAVDCINEKGPSRHFRRVHKEVRKIKGRLLQGKSLTGWQKMKIRLLADFPLAIFLFYTLKRRSAIKTKTAALKMGGA